MKHSSWFAAFVFACVPFQTFAATVSNVCFANAWESCFIVIDGPITLDTPAQFAELRSSADGGSVLFNSNGGDVAAAIALGRQIKAAGLSTMVGARHQTGDMQGGDCRNACLFAFAGGFGRAHAADSKLSFSWADTFTATSAQTNILAAGAFLAEQDIQDFIFTRDGAAGPISDDDLSSSNLISTPSRVFSSFVLEPYRGGLVAVSTRLDEPHPYDRVTHLTAYCRDDQKLHFLLTSTGSFMSDEGEAYLSLLNAPNDSRTTVTVEQFKTWTGDDRGFVEFSVNRDALTDLETLTSLGAYYKLPRVAGAVHWATIGLTEMDRQMMLAVTENCIQ